jgi:hypothetical protein
VINQLQINEFFHIVNIQKNTMKNLKNYCSYQMVLFLIFMMIAMTNNALAHRHSHRIGFGISFGGGGYYPGYYGSGIYGPGVWSPGFYGYRPYGYWDPFFMRPPVYVMPPTTPVRPPVYVQRQEFNSTSPQAGYWHYCQNPAGYYPTVKNCSQSWILVPPRPPE